MFKAAKSVVMRIVQDHLLLTMVLLLHKYAHGQPASLPFEGSGAGALCGRRPLNTLVRARRRKRRKRSASGVRRAACPTRRPTRRAARPSLRAASPSPTRRSAVRAREP
jgi:hypothetical protein